MCGNCLSWHALMVFSIEEEDKSPSSWLNWASSSPRSTGHHFLNRTWEGLCAELGMIEPLKRVQNITLCGFPVVFPLTSRTRDCHWTIAVVAFVMTSCDMNPIHQIDHSVSFPFPALTSGVLICTRLNYPPKRIEEVCPPAALWILCGLTDLPFSFHIQYYSKSTLCLTRSWFPHATWKLWLHSVRERNIHSQMWRRALASFKPKPPVG